MMNPIERELYECELRSALLRGDITATQRTGRAFALGFAAGALLGALLILLLA